MKYTIFELDSPEVLEKIVRDGYDHRVESKMVLKDVRGIQQDHSSFESAKEEIERNANDLKLKDLVILPVFSINYGGNIQEV